MKKYLALLCAVALTTHADTVTNLVVEGGLQQGGGVASGASAAALGTNTVAAGFAALATGEGTDAYAPWSFAGGYGAFVHSIHTGAFIHAMGQGTLFGDTAHFDRLVLFSAANDHSNSVLARWQNDLRYATTNQGAKADSALQPGSMASLAGLAVSGTITSDFVVAKLGYSSDGGNARGSHAVDLQTARDYAYQVASGDYSAIGGGLGNASFDIYCTVAGGRYNSAGGGSNSAATVGGGVGNYAQGWCSTVAGGVNGVASKPKATVGGGNNNIAGGTLSTIAGGDRNEANYPNDGSAFAFIGGGLLNKAGGVATIGGGHFNTAWGGYSFIGGGYSNTAAGFCNVVAGGTHNKTAGWYSFAAGQAASALHDGAFVWADYAGDGHTNFYNGSAFASTGTNQFLIRATGGVGIGTNSPKAQLHVAGTTRLEGETVILCLAPQGDLSMGSFTNRP